MKLTAPIVDAIEQAVTDAGSAAAFAAACGVQRCMPMRYVRQFRAGRGGYITDDVWCKLQPRLQRWLPPAADPHAMQRTAADPPRIIQDAPGDAYRAAHLRLSARAICLALIFDALPPAQQDVVELQIRSMELTARQTPTGAAHVPPAAH